MYVSVQYPKIQAILKLRCIDLKTSHNIIINIMLNYMLINKKYYFCLMKDHFTLLFWSKQMVPASDFDGGYIRSLYFYNSLLINTNFLK